MCDPAFRQKPLVSGDRIHRIKTKAIASYVSSGRQVTDSGCLSRPASTRLFAQQGRQDHLTGIPTSTVVDDGCCCNTLFLGFFPDNTENVSEDLIPNGYTLPYYFVGFVVTSCSNPSVTGRIIYDGIPFNTTVVPLANETYGDVYFTYTGLFPSGNGLPPTLPGDPNVDFDCTLIVNGVGGDAEFGCFLKGTPVAMADGTTKPIEDIRIGDVVIGAFGEHNPVLALHQPFLGASKVANINNEHKTTTHHPHIGAAKGFHCIAPGLLTSFTYGKNHTVILANGMKEKRQMTGVAKDRIRELSVGTVLQTLSGPREVMTIEYIPMPPVTKVYHLVVGGSHTYTVDGYAVTGWATETDFDYDAWAPKA